MRAQQKWPAYSKFMYCESKFNLKQAFTLPRPGTRTLTDRHSSRILRRNTDRCPAILHATDRWARRRGQFSHSLRIEATAVHRHSIARRRMGSHRECSPQVSMCELPIHGCCMPRFRVAEAVWRMQVLIEVRSLQIRDLSMRTYGVK